MFARDNYALIVLCNSQDKGTADSSLLAFVFFHLLEAEKTRRASREMAYCKGLYCSKLKKCKLCHWSVTDV